MKNEHNHKYLLMLKIIITLFILGAIFFAIQLNKLQGENAKLATRNINHIEKHGRLSVKGTNLVDEHGEAIVLKGLSSHGLTWFPEYINYRTLTTIKNYGANVFRVAMYVEQNDGYLEEPELNEKLMYSAIENSLAAGLYTIVDWHVLRDENPNKHAEKALAMFEKIAKEYGDEPGIIYEICNEPNGDTTYEDIVAYANKVIPIIRKYAPNAVILVGTPKFCTSLKEAIENPIGDTNLMYTYHFYAGVSDCKFALSEISKALENGLPVFVSEWGIDGYKVTNEHKEETKKFMNFLNQNRISWVNWSLSNKKEGYSFVSYETDKLHDWTMSDLTSSGKFVLEYLQENN